MNKNKFQHKYNIFLKSMFVFFLLLLLSTPFIINGIFPTEISSATWIGFWGSFAGGILGTLGVIFVAFLQSKEQRMLNEISFKLQRDLNEDSLSVQRKLNNEQIRTQINSLKKFEHYNRQRLKVSSYIKKLEQFNEDLNSFLRVIDELSYEASGLYKDLLFYIRIAEKSDRKLSYIEIEKILGRMDKLKTKSDNIINHYIKLSNQEKLLVEINIVDKHFLESNKTVKSVKNIITIITLLLEDADERIDYKALKIHVDTMEQLLDDSVLELLIKDVDNKSYVEKNFKSFYQLQTTLGEVQNNTIKTIVKYLDGLDEI